MKKLFRILVLSLPAVLYFSYFPVISLGGNETMNFELSLPLIWLVVFDIVSFIMVIRERKFSEVIKKWWWGLFPIFATLSLIWTENILRGVLTVGILWLVVFAILAFVIFREEIFDDEFRKKFLKVFFISGIAVVLWCVLQCVLDVAGVPRENSLLCAGCVSGTFGFPHPNGFAIEPQFMGNLLLAPAIVSMWFSLNNKKYDILLFIFAAGIFLTFSRGAIYAFIVAMIFMTVFMIVRTKSARTLILWPVVILSFLFTLNLQGIFAEVGPTSDNYVDGVSKVVNHLSLGIIDFRLKETEVPGDAEEVLENEPAFDGYVEESTNVRVELTEAAMEVWTSDFKTMAVGVGIGGAGQAMYEAGLNDSPKEIVQNEYASVLVELGAVGAIIAVFMIVMIIRVVVKFGGESSVVILTLLVAYAVTLCFFSGLANALQIYLLPAVMAIVFKKAK